MNNKQIKMLKLLDNQIQCCCDEKCGLYVNGRAKPYWTEKSKYMCILEAPGKGEVENNEVIIGKTGRMFWDLMAEYQLTKDMFLILNSVNCRVLNGRKNGKPAALHRERCLPFIRKYIKIFKPKHLILFGNYAMNSITGEWGINSFYPDSLLTTQEVYGINMNIIRSVHPSSLIYGGQNKDKLVKSIETFKEVM